MAELFVRHSLNPNKGVKFNFTFKQFTLKNKDAEGDAKWVLEVGTTYPATDGGKVPTKVIYGVTTQTLATEIEKAVGELCAYIDWSEFDEDKYPPEAMDMFPTGIGIPLSTLVSFKVIDELPSSGIDLSDMQVILNNGVVDFDITDQMVIAGDPYEYLISWKNPFN